jgi:hypothetical protein
MDNHGAISATINRLQKITSAEMRSAAVRGLLVYCADYRCSHYIAISGDRWSVESGRDERMADVYLGIMIAGINTLIVLGTAFAFVVI